MQTLKTIETKYLALHLLFWTSYLVVQALVYMNFYEFETIKVVAGTGAEIIERSGFPDTFWTSLWVQGLELPGKLLAVYLHLWVMVEGFLFRRRFVQYLIGLVLILLLANVVQAVGMQFLPVPPFMKMPHQAQVFSLTRSLQYIFTCLAVVGFTGALAVLQRYYEEYNRRQEVEKQHIVTELQLLKAQIHPHFFFNTLNSLYGLAMEKSEQTPGMILRLSELMNFVLYEAKAKDVPLLREIEIIEDYIALEKVRYGERVQVAVSKTGLVEVWRIPPLLLLPFVENAFKHGVSPEAAQAWLNISISAEVGHLKCVVENSRVGERPSNGNAGLGLENVRRRLELLFPERHRLSILAERDAFMVVLELNERS